MKSKHYNTIRKQECTLKINRIKTEYSIILVYSISVGNKTFFELPTSKD